MPLPEEHEKARQAIMRFRELLDIMRMHLEEGEQAYRQLFAHLPPEAEGLPEKERQALVARSVVEDSTALRRAALQLRFDARDMERAFEEVHDNLVT